MGRCLAILKSRIEHYSVAEVSGVLCASAAKFLSFVLLFVLPKCYILNQERVRLYFLLPDTDQNNLVEYF